jgi:pimeloyl-ACP methyl ester carboxylesterase
MRIRLDIFTSTDKLELPGLFYTPDTPTRKVAIYLHGNGDSDVFYQSRLVNVIGRELTSSNIAFLAFNNRGARHKKKLVVAGSGLPGQEDTFVGGTHYELIEDCMNDIDGIIDQLNGEGYLEFYLIGFSTGANKICVYDSKTKNNRVSKYILAGPGDDSGVFYSEIGEKQFWLSIKKSQEFVREGKPLRTMPRYSGMYPFSAQSAYDILNPDGPYNTFPYYETTTKRLGNKPLFEEYKKITKPMLVVFGEFDEFTHAGGGAIKTLNLLESVTSKEAHLKSSFQVINSTDHGFHGQEKKLAKTISSWLREL